MDKFNPHLIHVATPFKLGLSGICYALFVIPSPTETFGNVVLESLSSGTLVIGANSGGVKSIIRNGMTGHLCEPGYVQGFSAIINLLKSEDLNRIEGRDYALTQKRDKIFNDLIGHYETVIGGNKEKRYA